MSTAVDTNVALVSLAEAKEYLRVTNANDDLIISHLINAISQWVSDYLNRSLVSKTYVEYYSGDGSDVLILRCRPLISLTSVYVDQLRLWTSDTLVDSSDLILKKGAGILQAFNLFGNWECGQSNIKITYVAGYSVATDGGATGDMPYGIRYAVKRLLDQHYRIGYANRKLDWLSESISGMNVTFRESGVPKDVMSMLDGYRKIIPASQYEYSDDSTVTPTLASSSGTFVDADLSSSILTVTHNRGLSAPYSIQIAVFDNNGNQIVPDAIISSANSFQIVLTSFAPITGTWGYIYAT